MSWLRLANQTAVITGAGSGIGRAIALALAEQSCNLLLTDVHFENLEQVASECTKAIPNNNTRVESIVCDVIDESQVKQTIQKADLMAASSSSLAADITSPSFSVASILVNCAGITRDGRVTNLSDNDWDNVLDINLKGTYLMCKHFCEPSRATTLLSRSDADDAATDNCTGGGSIINIGSIVSEYGNMGQVNYAASKGGVVGLTRSLAKEMALFSHKMNNVESDETKVAERIPPAIRVNCIQPGFIHTPMAHAVPNKILSQMKQRIALRRLGQVEDVANLALFLASNARSGYITGEVMECSGMLRL